MIESLEGEYMAQQDNPFSGIWRSTYWFPSNQRDGEDTSEYYVEVHQRGNKLVLESLPQQSEAYMVIHLTVDDDLATGVWEETTAPAGEFKGAVYSGALQLVIAKDGKKMTGKWVGVGQDEGVRSIYTGAWGLVRVGQKPSDLST
jgi:hypothetical protein